MARLSDYSGNERVADNSKTRTITGEGSKSNGCGGVAVVLIACIFAALAATTFWYFGNYEIPGEDETGGYEKPVAVGSDDDSATAPEAPPRPAAVSTIAAQPAPVTPPKKTFSDKQFTMTVRSKTEQFVRVRQRSSTGLISPVFGGTVKPGIPETVRAGGEITVISNGNLSDVSIEVAGKKYTATADTDTEEGFLFVPEE